MQRLCDVPNLTRQKSQELAIDMENSMKKRVGLALLFLCCCTSPTAFAQTDSDDIQVRKLINEFESALARKDIAAVGSLVSPQIVVFENGYRNDGWQDFRDNHLIPEFKHSGSHASAVPFEDAIFSGAVALTMLHHVPSPTLQDRLLSEVYRVLKSGGVFVGTDSIWSPGLWLIHIGDTLVPVDPRAFKSRLESAGFTDVHIELGRRRFRFSARRA